MAKHALAMHLDCNVVPQGGSQEVLELPADPGTRITGTDAWANYPLGVWRSLKEFSLPQPVGFDLGTVGRLLTAFHRSSQHLFENSTPALDQLVDLLEPHLKVYGARLTGGGFGGAVMALTRADFSESDAAGIATRYAAQHGRVPEVIHLQTADGAQLLR